jgi:hypothetical protein
MARTSPGGRILLCEYATQNADKTFTIVRGGIGSGAVSAAAPQPFYCFVELDPDVITPGAVSFDIVLVAPNGVDLPVRRVTVQAEPGEPCRFAGKVPLYLYQPGRYRLQVRVGELTAECSLTGVPMDPPVPES